MRRLIAAFIFVIAAAAMYGVPPPAQSSWRAKVAQAMPLLGHRNWILIVDSAYPLQSAPGIETIETNAHMIDVVQSVLAAINNSIHVRPDIYMDAELPFVQDQDAPGASAYRKQIAKALEGHTVESVLHDKIIADIGETGSQFHVLVLKTNLAIPYSSVFVRLDCKYWSADAEKRMRERMKAAPSTAAP
ncbi:MAG: RbsD/FucU domain-containing protein [Terracidiphilus sp.]